LVNIKWDSREIENETDNNIRCSYILVLVLLTNFSNHDQVIKGSEEVVVMLRW
jgi:hypothetical protein